MFRAMANAGWSRRSRRSWRRCEHVSSTVVRATFSPTAVLLLLLVASLLGTFLVLNTCGAMSSAGHMQLCWLLACAGASTS